MIYSELLKSAANSRRPSFTWSEHSKEVYFNALATAANSRIGSRRGSIAGNFNLSWRNTLLEPGYTPLPKVEDV
uniref:COesterase domain-containing protein n=1 Tax=Heterorhabditis bacteriophora TaxID=37862 RepID=A0A1I7XJQ8_HETBA